MKVTQHVAAAVPVRVQQATLAQLDGTFALPVAPPADALPDERRHARRHRRRVQPKLAGALPGVRRCFESYPYICLEQKTSKSVGLNDAALWAGVANALADLPRQRRPGELLPAARRRGAARQRPPHRVRAGRDARGRLRAAAGGARRDARRARSPSSKAASSASSGRRAPTSTCASSPRSRRCRATAGRSRGCSARSTSRRTSGRRRR